MSAIWRRDVEVDARAHDPSHAGINLVQEDITSLETNPGAGVQLAGAARTDTWYARNTRHSDRGEIIGRWGLPATAIIAAVDT
jgi:predicted RNA-binding protein YlqC (UPF0109 family)